MPIGEAPRIARHRAAMRRKLADLPGVGINARTTERLGLTGRGEGIAAQAIATMISREDHET